MKGKILVIGIEEVAIEKEYLFDVYIFKNICDCKLNFNEFDYILIENRLFGGGEIFGWNNIVTFNEYELAKILEKINEEYKNLKNIQFMKKLGIDANCNAFEYLISVENLMVEARENCKDIYLEVCNKFNITKSTLINSMTCLINKSFQISSKFKQFLNLDSVTLQDVLYRLKDEMKYILT